MRNVCIAILIGFSLLLSACGSNSVKETEPLHNIVLKEVKVPVASCPKDVDNVKLPTRPALAIDELTPADKGNFKKVGAAYMTTINDLMKYSKDLEDVAQGVKDICQSVNTPLSGK